MASTSCLGYVDSISDQRIAGGWAWDNTTRRPAHAIVLTLVNGVVVGFGEVGLPRPDVQTNMHIPDLRTGWSVEEQAPKGSRLRAFALLGDSQSICELRDERGHDEATQPPALAAGERRHSEIPHFIIEDPVGLLT